MIFWFLAFVDGTVPPLQTGQIPVWSGLPLRTTMLGVPGPGWTFLIDMAQPPNSNTDTSPC